MKRQMSVLSRRLRRRAAALWRRKDGSTVVEFAFVAAPFMALLFAIIQTALVFFADQVLQTVVADSARLIMTGQAQAGNFDANAFKTEVCRRVVALFDCANGVYVDVRKFSSFGSVTLPSPVNNGDFTPSFVYQPGVAGDIIVVRLFYLWPVFTGPLSFNLQTVNGGKFLITATAAFKNEPF